MLIKMLHRKLSNPGLFQLATYINQGRELLENEPDFAIRYNTNGETMRAIAEDFQRNNTLIPKRKNRNGIGHYIISFHPQEKRRLNSEKLFTIAQKFCEEIEADKKIVFARPHFDRANYHVHFMVSASKFGSGKSSRISKPRLRAIKQEMDRFQQQNFPELKQSLLHLSGKEVAKSSLTGIPLPQKFKESDGSLRVKRRRKISQLDSIRKTLVDIGKQYPDKEAFLIALKQQGIETYQYRNRCMGY